MKGEVRIYTEKKRIYKEYTQKNIHRVYTEKKRRNSKLDKGSLIRPI